jgi:hypothetical protein
MVLCSMTPHSPPLLKEVPVQAIDAHQACTDAPQGMPLAAVQVQLGWAGQLLPPQQAPG